MKAIEQKPTPHFSWHIAESYEIEALEEELRNIAKHTEPFYLKTSGLGIFTNLDKVVYIPIVRDPCLNDLHLRIWDRTHGYGYQGSQLYSPSTWVPHITIAHNDFGMTDIQCVLEVLVHKPLNWRIKIDNFALACNDEVSGGEVLNIFNFTN
jgi:2'-5' RNA ligase